MLDRPYRLHRRRSARLAPACARDKSGCPRDTPARCRSRWIGLVVAGALTVASVGCAHLLPSRPWPPQYIVNRGGDFYMGSRCSAQLADAGVFDHAPGATGRNSVAFDEALWYAVAAPPGVAEFKLFAANQDGVAVVRDVGAMPYSAQSHVYAHDDRGQLLAMTVALDQIAEGNVATYAGSSSWEEFMKRPSSDFGC